MVQVQGFKIPAQVSLTSTIQAPATGDNQNSVGEAKPSAVWHAKIGQDGNYVIPPDATAGDVLIDDFGNAKRIKIKRNGEFKLVNVKNIRPDDFETDRGTYGPRC